jgi:hypothetical protein
LQIKLSKNVMLSEREFSILFPGCLKITRLANQLLDDAELPEDQEIVKTHITEKLLEIRKEVDRVIHDLKLVTPIV